MDLDDETWQVGLRSEKTKPCTFYRNRAMGFGESAKNGSQRHCFCDVSDAPLLPLSLNRFPTNTCPGGGSRHMVSYSRKVSIKGSNFPKNPLFRVPHL